MSGAGQIRVGVVGAGGIAPLHLDAWQRLGVGIRVYSLDGRGSVLAQQFGGLGADSLDELIAQSDVIDVCAPTYAHPSIVAAAAAAGRHVICEKPLATSREEAADMIARCEAAGVQLFPGQVVRYFPQNEAAKRAVDAGRIGRPAVLRLSRRGAAPVADWFAVAERSGGVIVDQMIHDIDYARWIAGDVRTVWATIAAGEFSSQQVAYVLMTHENGTLSHLTGGWGGPAQRFATSFSLAGSAGLIEHDSPARAPLRWELPGYDPGAGSLLPELSLAFSPYLTELAEFLAAFRGGPAPRVTAADSLAALEIALAATRSARIGEPVTLSEVSA